MKTISELYNKSDRELMHSAEISRLPGKNRVEEIKAFARNAGYKKLALVIV